MNSVSLLFLKSTLKFVFKSPKKPSKTFIIKKNDSHCFKIIIYGGRESRLYCCVCVCGMHHVIYRLLRGMWMLEHV